MTTTTEYRVELDVFSGPLDLLLYLVRRNELEILELPVAAITAQFQEYLDVLELIDLDMVGDFIVMASTLAEIKSRLVLPRPEEDTGPEITEDPRGDLIQQLLEYKKFKDAARFLEERATDWQERYPRLTDDRPQAERDASADRIKEVVVWDLVSALGRVLKKQQARAESAIRYDETPTAVYVEQIGAAVREAGRVVFTSLFERTTSRSQVIGMFLAILELLRYHRFRAEQLEPFDEIWILPPEPGNEPEPAEVVDEPEPDAAEPAGDGGVDDQG